MAAAMEEASSSSSSLPRETKKIMLKSSDNAELEVEEAVALQSQTIKEMIKAGCADDAITLPDVTAEILKLVIEYCEKHVEDGDKSKNSSDTYTPSPAHDELKKWDAEFVKVDQDTLIDLMLAAYYLNIKGLLGLTCQAVAQMMKGKEPSTMADAIETKKIMLKSSCNEDFEVEEAVALQSQTIKEIIEAGCADNAIPLPCVTGEILYLVIEYCKKHVENGDKSKNSSDTYTPSFETSPAADELKKWDAEFVKVDQDTLFDLMLAANYLNIKGLLDLTCKTVADMMRGKTPDEIRKTFNIINDYNPEEEEQVRRENQWAFE